MKLFIRWMVCASLALVSLVASAAPDGPPLRLVTDDEARRPDARVPTTRAITRGPGVKLVSASEVNAGGFPMKVQFERRGGVQLDPQSVRVEYLKEPMVDLTDRVRSRVAGDAIEISQATLPPGEHHFRVTVKDAEGRQGGGMFSIRAR